MSAHREGKLAVEGATLHYRIDGAGEGKPWLVFGNSLLTSLAVWEAQVAALAGQFAILRYDQRGHGQSTISDGPVDFTLLGADLLALMDEAGIGNCTYTGLSMGVPTGLAAHARAPERFDRLVFVDGGAKTAATGKAFWEERIGLARQAGIGELAKATIERWFSPSTNDPEKRDRLRAMIAATPIDGFEQCARALQDYDFRDAVAGIDCPLLTIAGADDGVMPGTMDTVFGEVALRQAVTIPMAGHIPNYERPDEFNRALTAFLKGDVA